MNFVLALINGPIRAIAVAPHIDKPDANKTLSFKSNLNTIPKIKDNTNEKAINLWIVSDNLLRGAALNAVEIAEAYIKTK